MAILIILCLTNQLINPSTFLMHCVQIAFGIESDKPDNFRFRPEQGRNSQHRLFMAIGFNNRIGMMVIILASPFKMGDKASMKLRKIFYCLAAFLGGMSRNYDVAIHRYSFNN